MLAVPSVKYHLPRLDEAFRASEYRYTTRRLAESWGAGPLFIEKDFSPTLAGDPLADERAQVLRWVREVPGQIRQSAPGELRLALKLMNARFDDAFQAEMLQVAADSGADTLVVFNRLFDPARGVAYGGWDLSDRNLAVLDRGSGRPGTGPSLTGTGNVCSGRMIVEYARRGCESVQLHTFFQLPLGEYPATRGSRTQRALHVLLFDPRDGLVPACWRRKRPAAWHAPGGELRFRDLAAGRAVPGAHAASPASICTKSPCRWWNRSSSAAGPFPSVGR